ncbi:selenide, water dikinase SelD [candidate division WOR-3 bacterium]|nr:selenide, water dikinase SelD [candidate division WOR-3 bacterium]
MGRRLTQYSKASGCAAKVCQEDLLQVLQQLPVFRHPDLLVGGDTSDDAGVYRLDNERALVLTVDVLTPIADDPYVFGQIAAANSLSDVYAMGGTPLAALCIFGYPVGEIDNETIEAVLAGAWDKVREADAVVAGGHTMKDTEVKFGLSVTGVVHPDRVVRNVGARPGDVLVLTKPIGSGVITTALREDLAPSSAVTEASRVMSQLNRAASDVMCAVGVNAATDITGFGLLGHAWEMAQAGGIDFVIDAGRVPLMSGAADLSRQRFFPQGSLRNYDFMKSRAEFANSLSEETRRLLCDAQTSGGLLASVSTPSAEELVNRLHKAGVADATVVGSVCTGTGRVCVA